MSSDPNIREPEDAVHQQKQKRARRAKAKAKEARLARQNPQPSTPIVPDYFMPDLGSVDDYDEEFEVDDEFLESCSDPEILTSMDDEERQTLKDLMNGTVDDLPTEDEMLFDEVFTSPGPEPTEDQRIAHYEQLKHAEQEGQHALLTAFIKGPVAAHALFEIDFEKYVDVLAASLGGYWQWAHALDEQSIRARIDNDDFFEALREVLSEIEEEEILKLYETSGKKDDEPGQDPIQ